MFRKHEKTIAWKSGLLAALVHIALVGVMLFSFNWKAAHTVVSVSDVELWSELPNNSKPLPPPVVPKEEPKPVPEDVEKPEPEPEVVEKPEEPKVDIELENKKKAEEEKRKLEEKKKADKKKKLAEKKKAEKKRREQLKKLQQAAFDDEVVDENEKRLQDLQKLGQSDTERPSGASQGEINKYVAKIKAKIKGNVNRSLCTDGSPQVIVKLNLLPTGEFSSAPVLSKSSGNAACDDAIERAVIASEPLPLPANPDAFSDFRNLNLKFRPNE